MNPQRKKCIHDFLRSFLPALTQAQQYTISHRLTISAIDTAFSCLMFVFDPDTTLSLIMVDDRIVVDKEPLEDTLYSGRFIQFFRSRGVEHLTIDHGVTKEELALFIETLSASSSTLTDNISYPHISFGKVGLGDIRNKENIAESSLPESMDEGDEKAVIARHFDHIPDKESGLMTDIYSTARGNRSLPDREIKQVVTDIVTAIKQVSSLLLAFSPLRVIDEYTFTHSTNVCILVIAQAMALRMRDEEIYNIGVSAMLHDIGKLFIPEEVLNKQGALTDKERDIIKQHPIKGAEYLVDKPGIPPLAVVVAYEHHISYDYSGYPKVPDNRRLNICSHMTTIADFFDALRTKRPYRGPVEARIIAEDMASMSGKALNPVLTKNFLILLKKLFPEM